MGGEEKFIERLRYGIDHGLIVIDNQPGFLQATMFNYTSKPYLTSDYLAKKHTLSIPPPVATTRARSALGISGQR